MNSTRVRELLAAAAELEPPAREDFLSRECGSDAELRAEVESLLQAGDSMGDFLARPAFDQRDLEVGQEFAGFAVVRRLGAGGAGTVYEAEQRYPRRRVALKILRDQAAEAQIHARLQHPAIAAIYEAGTHDGTPYLALELVEGARPIHAAARDLDIAARLRLFARVCDAVHHGHQKGVVHRDLKPGNLLVDSAGRPKVIDFGIARMEDAPGGIAGTLPYMSPEQGEESVDVRGDVYALGAVLHEILAGSPPHDVAGMSFSEGLRRVQETPPAPLPRAVHGDLRAIVAKALHRERDRRYASAAALADDVRRHLEHRPVEARNPGVVYQLLKFARRHRVVFASFIAILTVSIVAAVANRILAVESEAARRAAEFQAYIANVSAAAAALRENDVGEASLRLERAPAAYRNWEWRHLESRLDQSERTIEWRYFIKAGAVGPRGRLVAASSYLGEFSLGVWDLAEERRIDSLVVPGRIDALAFSPDGERLAVGYSGGAMELREARSPATVLWRLAGSGGAINAVAYSADGTRLISASRDGMLRIRSAATGAPLQTLEGHTDRAIDVRWGARIVSGGREGVARIWKEDGSSEVFPGHTGSVEGVALSPDGSRLATVSRDLLVRLRDVATGRTIAVLDDHRGNVRDVDFSPDGETFATASADRTIRVYRSRDGSSVACLRGHRSRVQRVRFLPDGRLVSFSSDGTIKCWPADPRDTVLTLRGHSDLVQSVAIDDSHVASMARDRSAIVWQAADGREIARLPTTFGASTHQVASEERFRAGWGGLVGADRLDALRRLLLRVRPMSAVAPDGKTVLVGASNGPVLRYDARTAKALAPLADTGRKISALVIGLGTVVVGTQSGELFQFDLATGRRLAHERAYSRRVIALTLSDAAGLIAVSSHYGSIDLRDGRTLRLVARLSAFFEDVNALAFSPDGTRLVSGSADGALRVWDVRSRRPVVVLEGHDHAINALAFSPDGEVLASAGGEWEVPGAVKLWRAPMR